MENEKFAIVVGNVCTGFQIYGPYDSEDECEDAMRDHDTDCTILCIDMEPNSNGNWAVLGCNDALVGFWITGMYPDCEAATNANSGTDNNWWAFQMNPKFK